MSDINFEAAENYIVKAREAYEVHDAKLCTSYIYLVAIALRLPPPKKTIDGTTNC